jgi:hypothetical protein
MSRDHGEYFARTVVTQNSDSLTNRLAPSVNFRVLTLEISERPTTWSRPLTV